MSITETPSTPSGQTELTKERIIEALRPVPDPELGRGLIELGMVPDVQISGRDVRLTIELATPVYPAKPRLERDVRAALATMPEIGDVDIRWTSRVRASGAGKSDAQPIKG